MKPKIPSMLILGNSVISVISGGQTGVDRAALDSALAMGIPCGGWCPKGRRAEDGTIPLRYPLRETPLRDYGQRTVWNVRDSDATLVLVTRETAGGTALALRTAASMEKPLLVADPGKSAVASLREWVDEYHIATLNVAGARESECPGMYSLARRFLDSFLSG